MDIETLEIKVRIAHDRWIEAKRVLEDAKLKAVKERWKIEIGDIVLHPKRVTRCNARRGRQYKIGKIDVNHVDTKPWIYGYQRNKNGQWSKRATCLYMDWEKARPVPPTGDSAA